MASKPVSIVENPNWNSAQKKYFKAIGDALPVAMGYYAEEIPVLDNHTDGMLIDETGALKQVKKFFEKPEKAHVERLKARIGNIPTGEAKHGNEYAASFRGGSRVILNQEACKELIEECNQEGIHIKRLIAAIKAGQIELPNNVLLHDPVRDDSPEESNNPDFFSTAAGGRALYVEPL